MPSFLGCITAANFLEDGRRTLATPLRKLRVQRRPDRPHSAILQVPNEILHQVFEQLVTYELKEINTNLPISLPTLPGVELLSKVCSRWRQVAIHTPALWTKIYVKLKGPASSLHTRLAGKRYTWIRIYLARSKGLPLDIVVDTTSSNFLMSIHEAIGMLLPYTSRWRSFRSSTSGWMYAEHFIAMLRHLPFPLLRHFDCSSDTAPEYRNWFHHGICTPQLESLSLTHVTFHSDTVSWNSVKTIELNHAGWPLFAELEKIFAAGALHTLVLQLYGEKVYHEVQQGANPPISLPQLCHLDITGDSGHSQTVLQLFTAPRLKRLIIHNEAASAVSSALKTLCRTSRKERAVPCRCYPSLTHLTLSNISGFFSGDIASRIALSFPNISHFSLDQPDQMPFIRLLEGRSPVPETWASNLCADHSTGADGHFVAWTNLEAFGSHPVLLEILRLRRCALSQAN